MVEGPLFWSFVYIRSGERVGRGGSSHRGLGMFRDYSYRAG